MLAYLELRDDGSLEVYQREIFSIRNFYEHHYYASNKIIEVHRVSFSDSNEAAKVITLLNENGVISDIDKFNKGIEFDDEKIERLLERREDGIYRNT